MRPRGSPTLHAATSEAAADLGSVRIKYKYSIQTVLAAEMYAPFIEAISANRFQLPVVLGKVTNEREDAAWAIVRLFHFQDEGSKCIVEIAKHEVQSTGTYPFAVGRGKGLRLRATDPHSSFLVVLGWCGPAADANTIFRGNSMASKAIDVHMKMIGTCPRARGRPSCLRRLFNGVMHGVCPQG